MNHPRCLTLLITVAALAGCRSEPTPASAPPDVPTTTAAPARTAPSPSAAPAPADDWVRVHPEGAGFSASFPSPPRVDTQRVSSPSGIEAEVRRWIVADERGQGVFMVSEGPLIEEPDDRGDPARALARLAAEQTAGPGRRVLRDAALAAPPFSGREVIARIDEGAMAGVEVRLRLFSVGDRLFEVMASGREEAGRQAARRFIASFSLDADAAGAPPAGAHERWQLRQAPGAGFRVALPQAPEVRDAAPRVTPWGERIVSGLRAVGTSPPAIYSAEEIRLSDAEATQSRYQLLDTWQAAVLAAAGERGHLDGRVSVKIRGLHGRTLAVRSSRPGGHAVVERHLGLVGQGRFYALHVVPSGGAEAAASERQAQRLFDSFRPGEPAQTSGSRSSESPEGSTKRSGSAKKRFRQPLEQK